MKLNASAALLSIFFLTAAKAEAASQKVAWLIFQEEAFPEPAVESDREITVYRETEPIPSEEFLQSAPAVFGEQLDDSGSELLPSDESAMGQLNSPEPDYSELDPSTLVVNNELGSSVESPASSGDSVDGQAGALIRSFEGVWGPALAGPGLQPTVNPAQIAGDSLTLRTRGMIVTETGNSRMTFNLDGMFTFSLAANGNGVATVVGTWSAAGGSTIYTATLTTSPLPDGAAAQEIRISGSGTDVRISRVITVQ